RLPVRSCRPTTHHGRSRRRGRDLTASPATLLVVPVETFLAADRMITTTIAALPPGAGTAVVEPVFATGTAGDGTVRAAVAHLARDEEWVPSQLAGETMAEAGAQRYDGDLLG